mgnify:CR=1 FL=1
MTTFTKSTLLTALMIPAAALAQLDVRQQLGSTESDVRAALTGMGYEVQEIEIEGNEIEAEVMLDGVELEIEVAMDTGLIIEIETEDDDGHGDD